MVWPLLTRILSGRGPGLGAGSAAAGLEAVSGLAGAVCAVAGDTGDAEGAGADARGLCCAGAAGAAALGALAGTGFGVAPEAGSSAALFRSAAAASPVPRADFARCA